MVSPDPYTFLHLAGRTRPRRPVGTFGSTTLPEPSPVGIALVQTHQEARTCRDDFPRSNGMRAWMIERSRLLAQVTAGASLFGREHAESVHSGCGHRVASSFL